MHLLAQGFQVGIGEGGVGGLTTLVFARVPLIALLMAVSSWAWLTSQGRPWEPLLRSLPRGMPN